MTGPPSKRRDDPSVHAEPHLRPTGGPVDPSERRAEQMLAREGSLAASTLGDAQNVADEPDIFPRDRVEIDRDWSCSRCGHNLRGLELGRPCPECGHIELYRPPAATTRSYGSWLADRMKTTPASHRWAVIAAGAPWGIAAAALAAFFGIGFVPLALAARLPLMLTYTIPAEELLKAAFVALIVEVRPYLFRNERQIYLCTGLTALAFAVTQNVAFFWIVAPKAGLTLLVYRWLACPTMQVGCSLAAATALARVWRQCTTEGRPPRLTVALGGLLLAILLHGVFFGIAISLESLFGPWR